MVRVHHGKKAAFFRLSGNSVTPTLCVGNEERMYLPGSDSYRCLDEALSFLADKWKIRPFGQYHEDGESGFYIDYVYGEQQIIVELPQEGELTEEQAFFWAFFNKEHLVHNIRDRQLWKMGVECIHDHNRRKCITTNHRPAYLGKWSVPKEPDHFYEKFVARVTQEFPDLNTVQDMEAPYGPVAYLERKGLTYVRSVAIEESSKQLVSIASSEGAHVQHNCAYEGLHSEKGIFTDVIRKLHEKQQQASWEALFPREWDVVHVQRSYFYDKTFAGHCYQTKNFFGATGLPAGYVIAWENRYNDMLLLRLGANGNIRCPADLKGKVIGTGGGNIKGIAKKFGREHWQIKLV
ncbi:MAG: hypothetical protein KBC41_01130 [Candidatus Pacebacteria bacterium]|nr:hypothetical protein [Candidatus Paceibacterota bacterium]